MKIIRIMSVAALILGITYVGYLISNFTSREVANRMVMPFATIFVSSCLIYLTKE